MTSVFALLTAAWSWGIVALGAHATAAQGPASDGGAGPYERAAISCPAPRETEDGGSAVGGDACRVEPRLHVGTRGSRGEVPGTPLPRTPVNSPQKYANK
jgi:hypothetical protein